jgi:predicted transcriptional regulator
MQMSESGAKKKILTVVEQLPDDATIEDAIERLYFLAKIEKGIREADAGLTVSHDEAKKRLSGE